jgi:LPS export ABC transporter protein LptC
MKTWRARLAWLALAIIAGLTSWLVIANRAKPQKTAPHAAQTLPDYSMRDAVITRYGETGRRHYVLHSHLVTHERLSDTSRLEGVKLNYYPRASAYWRLTARRGVLAEGGNRVVLIEQVRARQPEVTPSLHLATSKLTVLLDSHRISSTKRVTLRQGARKTRGIGLKADLDSGVVKLLKNVTSRYVD